MFLKKFFAAAVALSVFAVAAAGESSALPDVAGWQNGAARETSLDAASGERGFWSERDYRTGRGAFFHAVYMRGDGVKMWNIAPAASGDKKISGDGLETEYFVIADCPAVLESRSVLGLSLVVRLDGESVLTLESQLAEKDDLTNAAATLVGILKR